MSARRGCGDEENADQMALTASRSATGSASSAWGTRGQYAHFTCRCGETVRIGAHPERSRGCTDRPGRGTHNHIASEQVSSLAWLAAHRISTHRLRGAHLLQLEVGALVRHALVPYAKFARRGLGRHLRKIGGARAGRCARR